MNFLSPNDLYLCIDQGGHASRAIVFNHEGERVASAYNNVKTQYPSTNFVELNANEIIQSINDSIKQVLEKLGNKKKMLFLLD